MNAVPSEDPASRMCTECGAMLVAGAEFCRHCGARVRSSGAAAIRPLALGFLEPLIGQAPQDDPDTMALTATLNNLVSGVDAPQATVRGARFLLGRALLAANRPKKARAALTECRKEDGDRPPDADILLAVALGKLGSGTPDEALHDVFEALQASPAPLPDLIEVLLGTVSPQTIRPLSGWLVDTWRPTMLAAYPNGLPAAGVCVLAAACRLIEWRIDDFEAFARTSVELVGTDVAAGLWGRALHTPGFVEAVGEPVGPAGTQLAAAILARLFGQDDTALRLVDDALATTFAGDGYPEADAYRLRAELRLEAGDREQAAVDFLGAGRSFSWRDGRDDLPRAAHCLRQSIELAATAEAYWQLAHVQVRCAYVPEPPFADPDLLADAAEQWRKGRELAAPTTDTAWAYWTWADILHYRVFGEPDWSTELMWELWESDERWLVLVGETRADLSCVALAALSEDVASFGLKSVSAHLIRKALRIRDELGGLGNWDQAVLRQNVVVTYSFAPDEFEAAMNMYREAPDADLPWLDGVHASHLARTGHIEEALPLFEKAIEVNLGVAWMREHYAFALACCDRVEDALNQFAQLVELSEPGGRFGSPVYAAVRATALCHLGRTEEAVRLVRDLLAATVPFGDPMEMTALLVMCRLRACDFAAAEATAVELTTRPLTAAVLMDLQRDLRVVADLAVRDGAGPEVVRCAESLAASVTAKATVAAYVEDPSVALDELLREADRLTASGHWNWPHHARQSTFLLEAVGLTDIRGSDADAQLVIAGRLALAASLGGEVELAADIIGEFFSTLRDKDGVEPAPAVADLWAKIVNTAPELARSAHRIATYREPFDRTLGEQTVEQLMALLAERTAELLTSQETGLPDEPPARFVLRLGARLCPSTAETSQDWPMFAEDIPRMRDAIKKDTGVKMPSIWVVEADDDRRYAIMLDDLQLVEGTVPSDEPAPYRMLIAAVEREIRAHLHEFVGVDLVAELLTDWQQLPDVGDRATPFLEDAVALVRLTRVVRSLVADGTPVAPGTVLEAADKAGALSGGEGAQ